MTCNLKAQQPNSSGSKAFVVAAILFLWIASSAFALPQKQFQEDLLKTGDGDVKITRIGHGTLMFAYAARSFM